MDFCKVSFSQLTSVSVNPNENVNEMHACNSATQFHFRTFQFSGWRFPSCVYFSTLTLWSRKRTLAFIFVLLKIFDIGLLIKSICLQNISIVIKGKCPSLLPCYKDY